MSARGRAVILYDRDCGFCRWTVDKVLAWDRPGRLRPVAIQSAEGDRLLSGLEPEARLRSWHLVDEAGVLHSGGAAAEPLARLLPGAGWLSVVFRVFPGSTERAYRFVAAHRSRWARLLHIESRRR
jgi:predicted DCC family thiol-disulfide oxidoreductase YuxK